MKHMQGDNHGYWIAVLQGYGEGKEAHSMRTQWVVYQVDKSVGPILAELKKHKYHLHVTLIGKTNNAIAEDDREVTDNDHQSILSSLHHTENHDHNFDAYVLAPFLWSDQYPSLYGALYCPALPTQEFRINVPVNDLSDVARVTATIERIKEPEK